MKKFGLNEVLFLYCEIMDIKNPENIYYNKPLLESAINNIYSTFDDVELYPTIVEKATRLCFSLIKNHAFSDGNKRIGIASMLCFLHLNNIKLKYTQRELIDIGLGCAKNKIDYVELLKWVEEHII